MNGTHTYAEEGSYKVIVTLNDDPPGTATATANSTANVAEGDTLMPTTPQPIITTTGGSTFVTAAATFSDTTYPKNSPTDFTATINWGDGTTSPGTVSGGNGTFTVTGTHNFPAVPSDLVVTSAADNGDDTNPIPGSLRAAIMALEGAAWRRPHVQGQRDAGRRWSEHRHQGGRRRRHFPRGRLL